MSIDANNLDRKAPWRDQGGIPIGSPLGRSAGPADGVFGSTDVRLRVVDPKGGADELFLIGEPTGSE